jgi:hypothetical protein
MPQTHRRAAKVDANQPGIVKALRAIPGVSVQTGMDDILVGYNGNNYWVEIKEPDCVSKKTGDIRESALKPSQIKLRDEWQGTYLIAWHIDQILGDMGIE